MTMLSLEALKTAATKSYMKWDKLYDDLMIEQNKAIADVKSAGGHLPDNYWQKGHNARIRRESAKELLEIIREVEEEMKQQQQQKEPE